MIYSIVLASLKSAKGVIISWRLASDSGPRLGRNFPKFGFQEISEKWSQVSF